MDARSQYLTVPGEESPSVRTCSDRESTAASDIELLPLAPVTDTSEQSSKSIDSESTSIIGTPVLAATPNVPGQEQDAVSARFLAPAAPPDRPSAYNRLVLDTWICESIALIFSIGCVAAIAFIVGSYEGQRIPELPSGVTLNALISVLSTAARASLILVVSSCIGQLKWCWLTRSGKRLQDLQVMDEASRGPLGAISLLASRSGGSLASFGAAITLCMIAFGPFLQQLVDYPTRDVEQPVLNATAPQNLGFTLLTSNEHESQLMRSLVNAGLVFNSQVLTQTPRCPTARCSWQNFKSVGWCSKCRGLADTAYYLQDCNVKKYLGRDEWGKPFCNLLFNDAETQSWKAPFLMTLTHSNTTNSTFPDSPVLLEHTDQADTLSYLTSALWPSPPVHEFVAEDNTTVLEPMMMFRHASFSLDGQVDRDLHNDNNGDAIRVDQVTECFITLCESKYAANTTESVTHQTILSTDYGKTFVPNESALLAWGDPKSAGDVICWRPDDSSEDSTLITNDDGLTLFNESERIFCPIQNYRRAIQPHTLMSLSSQWYFNSTSASGNIEDFAKFRDGHATSNASDTQWSSGNFSSKLEGVAAALTSYGLSTSNNAVAGRVFLPQPYVRVRWLWIELPAFLQLASLVLFLSTVVYSRRIGVPTWKSSLLTICYHEVEELHERGRVTLLSDMDKASSTTSIQFFRGQEDSGFLLRSVPQARRHED